MNDDSFCEGDCEIGLGSTLNLFNAILLIVLLVVTSPWYVTDGEQPLLPDPKKPAASAATTDLPLTGNDDDLIMLAEEGKNDIPTMEDGNDNSAVPVCLLSPPPLEERIHSSFTPDGTTATHTDSCNSDNDDAFVDCRTGSAEEEEEEEMQQHIVEPQENGKVDEGCVRKCDVEHAVQEMQQQPPQVPNDCNVGNGLENDVPDHTDCATQAPPPEVLSDKNLSGKIVCPICNENEKLPAAVAMELISGQEQPLISDAIADDVLSSAPGASGEFAALVESSTTAPSRKTMTLPTMEHSKVSAVSPSSDPSASPPLIAMLVDQTVRTRDAAEVASLKAYHDDEVASLRQELANSEPATPVASREEVVLPESSEEVPTSMKEPSSIGEEVLLGLMEQSTMLIGAFGPITTAKDSTDDSSGDEAWESLLEEPSAPGADNSGAAAESGPSSAMNDSGETVLASFQETPAMICISSSEGSFTGDDSCDELLESSIKAGRASTMFSCINKTEAAAKQEDGSTGQDVLK
jgi:hypothetical protein